MRPTLTTLFTTVNFSPSPLTLIFFFFLIHNTSHLWSYCLAYLWYLLFNIYFLSLEGSMEASFWNGPLCITSPDSCVLVYYLPTLNHGWPLWQIEYSRSGFVWFPVLGHKNISVSNLSSLGSFTLAKSICRIMGTFK